MLLPDASLDPGLSVARPDPYVYKSPLKRKAAGLLDSFGDFWLGPEPKAVPWRELKRVALLRLDHLGDVINAFPAFSALRKALPWAQIDLYVGPWGREIAGLGAAVDRVKVVEAPWFRRPGRIEWPWRHIAALGNALRQEDYDLAVDLRGDLRHAMALWYSGTPYRLGHAITAGRGLLTHPASYDARLHEIDLNLEPLRQAGMHGLPEPGKSRPRLVLPPTAVDEAAAVMKKLKLRPGFVAVQAACGTAAKRWLPERWESLLSRIPAGREIVLLGATNEVAEMQALARRFKTRKPKLASGLLSLSGLAAFIKQARLLISVDSGPAHLGAAVGTPVLGLYSGTNLVSQWGVRGSQTKILRADVPCAPCELSVCPYDNECMRRISADEALRAAKKWL